MKTNRLQCMGFALLAAAAAAGARAADVLLVRPVLSVFKNAEAGAVTVNGVPVPADASIVVVKSPGRIRFGETELALDGATFSWMPGDVPPASLELLATPTMAVHAGQPAVVRLAPPAQYLERTADGALAVRKIDPDSPDAPRFVLTIIAESAGKGGGDLQVTYRPEIVTILGREPVQGVNLDIGKPRTSSFGGESRFTVSKGAWNALLVRKPTASDYGVLTLLKIEDPPAGSSSGAPAVESSAGSGNDADPAGAVFHASSEANDAGGRAAQSASDAAVRYLLVDGGFSSIGQPRAGDPMPTAESLRAAIETALRTAGYREARQNIPPSIVLIYHWGCWRSGGALAGYPGGSFTFDSFMIVSAYHYGDLANGKTTVLWRFGLKSGEPRLDKALLAMASGSAPYFVKGRASIHAPPSEAQSQTGVAQSARANFSDQIQQNVQSLIKKEQWTLSLYGDLPLMIIPKGRTEPEARPVLGLSTYWLEEWRWRTHGGHQ